MLQLWDTRGTMGLNGREVVSHTQQQKGKDKKSRQSATDTKKGTLAMEDIHQQKEPFKVIATAT